MLFDLIFVVVATVITIQFYKNADQIVEARKKHKKEQLNSEENIKDWWTLNRIRAAGVAFYIIVVLVNLFILLK